MIALFVIGGGFVGKEVLCRFKWCISCGKCHMGCCIKYFCMDKRFLCIYGGSGWFFLW